MVGDELDQSLLLRKTNRLGQYDSRFSNPTVLIQRVLLRVDAQHHYARRHKGEDPCTLTRVTRVNQRFNGPFSLVNHFLKNPIPRLQVRFKGVPEQEDVRELTIGLSVFLTRTRPLQNLEAVSRCLQGLAKQPFPLRNSVAK